MVFELCLNKVMWGYFSPKIIITKQWQQHSPVVFQLLIKIYESQTGIGFKKSFLNSAEDFANCLSLKC